MPILKGQFYESVTKERVSCIKDNNLNDMFPIVGSKGASYACFEKVNSPRGKLASCGFKNSSQCAQKYVCKVWLFF